MLYMKPAEGRTLRAPDGTPLPSRGAYVPNNSFWRRRLKAGDCVECNPPRNRKAKPAPTDKQVDRNPEPKVEPVDGPVEPVNP